jgi:predicted RNA-binding Zn ribbon-like protein
MKFDSHVLQLLTVSTRLVNALTPGHQRGTVATTPSGENRVRAVEDALRGDGRLHPTVTAKDADRFADLAARLRRVFETAQFADRKAAAAEVNALLLDTRARPRLDYFEGEGWHLHFHGADDSLVNGWSAGCAAGLALAIGSDLAGRLGICAAPACDRVFVDTSRNSKRRFCSPQCLSRVKAAAHRARKAPSPEDGTGNAAEKGNGTARA